MTYAEKLELLRNEKRVSARKFCDDAKVSQSSYSSYVRSLVKPNANFLRKIVQAYKLPQEYFLQCNFVKKSKDKKELPKQDVTTWVMHHTKKTDLEVLGVLKDKYESRQENILEKIETLESEFSYISAFVKDINDSIKETKTTVINTK